MHSLIKSVELVCFAQIISAMFFCLQPNSLTVQMRIKFLFCLALCQEKWQTLNIWKTILK